MLLAHKMENAQLRAFQIRIEYQTETKPHFSFYFLLVPSEIEARIKKVCNDLKCNTPYLDWREYSGLPLLYGTTE